MGCDVRNAPRVLDVLDHDAVMDAVLEVQPTALIHAAAITTAASDLELVDVNVCGTINALEAARVANVKHFVLLSSAGVYAPGQPEPIAENGLTSSASAYAVSKVMAERACELEKSSGMTVWILRLGAIYGPGETPSRTRQKTSIIHEVASHTVFLRNIKTVLDNGFALSRSANDAYNFLHTRDLARLLEWIVLRSPDGQTHLYNVAGPRYTALELLRVFDQLQPNARLEARVQWNPNPTPRHGALDPGKIESELGWRAEIPLPDGLLDYVEHRAAQQELEVNP
jgi:nucleoside-diphosphate-sugar epimerase